MKTISFVVPCYRSEKTISLVVDEIKCLMNTKKEYDYEVVLVNDCSPDDVWKTIEKLCKDNKNIKAINLSKNFGQHSALMAGYKLCRGDYVVTLDDDGQTPVDQTFFLVDKMLEGYDVVYAKYKERKDSLFRKAGTIFNNLMLEFFVGKPKHLHLTSFFVAREYVIKEMCNYNNPFPYIWGLVLRTTKNIANETIEHNQRQEGKSGYTLSKLIGLWMNGFTAFSVKPLRISFVIGLTFTVAGFFMMLYTVINKILNPDIVAGYSSLMSVILVIGGVLMVSIGLIGEYVGRIYMCINSTPQYVIKETINCEEK